MPPLGQWRRSAKVLAYHGTIADRREKRKGWTKPDAFHVCITSYQLAVLDSPVFRRKKWKYLILDEAHNIKNFESKRWQTLLRFNSKRRLLLTGTPLQNNLMELWSLLHFLMPNIFRSHQQFKEWFGNPMTQMVQGTKATSRDQQRRDQERVDRLHKLLRPFILRRLKAEVEEQVRCRADGPTTLGPRARAA
jgi:E1A-binding protein p400